MTDDLRARVGALLDKVRDAEGWPVVRETDGSRWVDRDWLITEIEDALR